MDVAFVKIDILANWRFWHRFKNDYEAAGREAIAQADALLAGDEDANERAGQLLREAKAFRSIKIANGRKGGRPRKAKAQKSLQLPVNADNPLPAGPLAAGGDDFTSYGDDQGAAGAQLESASVRPEGLTSSGPRQALTAITADYHDLPAGAVHQGSPTEAPAGASFQSEGAEDGHPSTSELYQFVVEDGLDEADAREWFEMHRERGWTDRKGDPIRNWKGALKRFCAAKAKKRSQR